MKRRYFTRPTRARQADLPSNARYSAVLSAQRHFKLPDSERHDLYKA